jgi:hypothetical protein
MMEEQIDPQSAEAEKFYYKPKFEVNKVDGKFLAPMMDQGLKKKRET